MDANRSNTLTNLLMMLPMVVVPTLALLKMPDQEGSMLGKIVAACTDNPVAAETESTEFGTDELQTDDLLQEATGDLGFATDPFQTGSATPMMSALSADSRTSDNQFPLAPAPEPATGPSVSEVRLTPSNEREQLLGQLLELGATRTMWFGPGTDQFGFVAFVPAGPGMVSYRFEAIAASPEAAIAQVATQVQQWKRQ